MKPKQSSVIQSPQDTVFSKENAACTKLRFSNFHRTFLTAGDQLQAPPRANCEVTAGPATICSHHARQPRPALANASATCPPPAARPPVIGCWCCPLRGEGASPAGRRSHWLCGGGSARGPGEEGKLVAAERAEAAGFVTVAPPRCEAWVGSGRAARGRSEWRPPGGGRAGGAGKEAAGGRAGGGRGGGRGGARRSRGRGPSPRRPRAAGGPGRPRAAGVAGGGPARRLMQPAGNTRRTCELIPGCRPAPRRHPRTPALPRAPLAAGPGRDGRRDAPPPEPSSVRTVRCDKSGSHWPLRIKGVPREAGGGPDPILVPRDGSCWILFRVIQRPGQAADFYVVTLQKYYVSLREL